MGALPQQAPQAGLRQFIGGLSVESLLAPNDDGRIRPHLAESWSTSANGLEVTVKLHAKATFSDGTPVTADLVAQSLRSGLPASMGPAYADVAGISAVDASTLHIDLKQPSQFVIEALETAIPKPGSPGVGTGPYASVGNTVPATLRVNRGYYLERPAIDQIVVTSYPTVRAAWADMLRGNLDMLNEVNLDALDSLQDSKAVKVFSYVRNYQYLIMFGPRSAALRDPEVRRELSAAIDREAIVREAMNGHAVPSSGPVSSRHWSMRALPQTPSSRAAANRLPARHLKFTCLVPADAVYERVALAVKRQLTAVGVDMELQQLTQDQVVSAAREGNFDALLGDVISGPTLFRLYRLWHSHTNAAIQPMTSPAVDAALDRVSHAVSDEEYSNGVTAFARAIENDPPALFLAWGERARAVSRRFEVPASDRTPDILNSIRLWRPAAPPASTN